MLKYFVLDANGAPVVENDREKWLRWFDTADRSVARSVIGSSQISTLFTGFGQCSQCPLDQTCTQCQRIWETAILGGPWHGFKQECAGNREQAEAMHQEIVERVRQQRFHP